jgi:hypothetical protein
MTRSRRLLLQASLTAGMGALALATPSRASAHTLSCGNEVCADSCSGALGAVDCAGCGLDVYPACENSDFCWNNFHLAWHGYCGAAM